MGLDEVISVEYSVRVDVGKAGHQDGALYCQADNFHDAVVKCKEALRQNPTYKAFWIKRTTVEKIKVS